VGVFGCLGAFPPLAVAPVLELEQRESRTKGNFGMVSSHSFWGASIVLLLASLPWLSFVLQVMPA
jgi:hypothetical protein